MVVVEGEESVEVEEIFLNLGIEDDSFVFSVGMLGICMDMMFIVVLVEIIIEEWDKSVFLLIGKIRRKLWLV